MATLQTLGSDCEFFVSLRDRNTPIPLVDYEHTSKNHKKPLMTGNNRHVGDYHRDNVLLELNSIPTSGPDLSDFVSNHLNLYAIMKQKLEREGLEMLENVIEHRFVVDTLPPDISGCGVSKNAWDVFLDVSKEDLQDYQHSTYRCAGGHLHIGYLGNNPYINASFVRALDIYLLPFLMSKEPPNSRRRFYGLVGEYRDKPYGFEYRAPSSLWFYSLDQLNVIVSTVIDIFKNDLHIKLDKDIDSHIKTARTLMEKVDV